MELYVFQGCSIALLEGWKACWRVFTGNLFFREDGRTSFIPEEKRMYQKNNCPILGVCIVFPLNTSPINLVYLKEADR